MAANPILDPSELKAHLNLLRAFHDLKSQVEDGSESKFNGNPEERWKSFVRVSVDRCVARESLSHGDTDISPFVDSTDGFPVSRLMIMISSAMWNVRLWTCALYGTRLC